MDIDRPLQAQPEKKTCKRLLRSAGLALFAAAFVLLPGAAVLHSSSAINVGSDEQAHESPVVSVFYDKPDVISEQMNASDDAALESHEPPQIEPIDYRLPCFYTDSLYTYDELVTDITETIQAYEGIVSCDVIGRSVQGKDIYALTVGRGPVQVLLTAGVHARENANTPLIMQCLFDYLHAAAAGDEEKAQMLDKVTLVVVPLVNPDGYQYCLKKHNGKKKTNANNVDINRNFPCKYWGSKVKKPGNFYPGPFPGSEPETQAIMALFDQYSFALAIDIHSRAREIICQKGGYTVDDISTRENPETLNEISLSLARYLREDIKYKLIKELKVKKGEEGTLTDYAFSRGVPTITFETLKYRKNRLASPAEIQKEYAFFDWPSALYKIAAFAANTVQ